jgi:hypothetical protein
MMPDCSVYAEKCDRFFVFFEVKIAVFFYLNCGVEVSKQMLKNCCRALFLGCSGFVVIYHRTLS